MNSVAEGVKTTRAVHSLGARLDVDLPIMTAIYQGLYEGKSARDLVADLLRREARAERG
jgi:glycerol-3-phosphate dehydrogenase (NAD(P)+)